MRRTRLRIPYLISDFVLSAFSWLLVWYLRSSLFSSGYASELNGTLILKCIAVGLGWLGLYKAFGLYRDTYRDSRTKELGLLLESNILGVVVLAFFLLFDDPFQNYADLQLAILYYFLVQSVLIGTSRFAITTSIHGRLQRGRIQLPTLVVGTGPRMQQLIVEIDQYAKGPSYRLLGCVQLDVDHAVLPGLPLLGRLRGLPQMIEQYKAEAVLLALDEPDHRQYLQVMKALQNAQVLVAAVPEMYDTLLGKVHIRSDMVYSLVEIDSSFQKPFAAFQKRLMDIFASLFALVLLSPVYFILACVVKFGSRGPVFYSQERIGQNGKPFRIYKFRSMITNAEKAGPALSQEQDPRITPVGRFLRKTRLDELPQFWNVLIGNMSLVGPRPERQFWINQITEQAPEYLNVLKVKPGITSLGQVRYGYASNVDEMIERMRYDLLYLENMSLSWDIRILLYTIEIVLKRKGK